MSPQRGCQLNKGFKFLFKNGLEVNGLSIANSFDLNITDVHLLKPDTKGLIKTNMQIWAGSG